MSYNLSINSLNRYKDLLDTIASNVDGEVVVRTDDPRDLSIELRQAIASARANDVAPYKDLNLKIRRSDGMITITHKKERQLVKEILIGQRPDVVRSFSGFGSSDDGFVEDTLNEFQVVAWISENNPKGTVTFPNFDGNMLAIKNWADVRGHRVIDINPLTIDLRTEE